ncbi:xanthine/CO dehydrogenase XdhC/CoxF family maturation factor [Virgibacillus natechei]|uniref:Xanthine/CO dehydrogenase XdhC/CoxF family maturation factor n=1 Tax=Virgibacillus natechei TaxID=1216297 RepID=A0ABS4IHJ7_9BACI|nr:DUF3048 domain-containing protein [Virgibacillus natechei]MBP1970420.1 xanthine/CO dehydrogenase XdhC/CoxF family maturation factor [Virgibacillus natechei]UZD13925.1 DUF3048 domain-containing protein [Virgibacillus natechei]
MRKLVYMLLVLFVLLVGCSNEEDQAQANESKGNNIKEKTEPPEVEGEAEEFENVFPLTGIGTNTNADNRMVSVMVNNHTTARPQTGLTQADMVFEILAEGDITRFLALYQSDMPDVVGPVRSAREYYFDLATNYNALYVYHGAANFVNEMIQNRGIEHLDGSIHDNNGHLFKRESFRPAPHNSYLQFDGVYDAAERQGYDTTASDEPLEFLTEDEEQELSGDSAEYVEIAYSDNARDIVEFNYDVNSEKYTRYNDQTETVDLATGDPIQVDNVFIVETHHQVIDDEARRSIDFESGGNAYLIQKGKIQEVEWTNQNGRIIPVKDGVPLGFAPGKTWINVVPSSPGIGQDVTVSS